MLTSLEILKLLAYDDGDCEPPDLQLGGMPQLTTLALSKSNSFAADCILPELRCLMPTAGDCAAVARQENIRRLMWVIRGPLPSPFAQLAHLRDLSLHDLTSCLPPELGQMQSLETLVVFFDNQFADQRLVNVLPAELGNLALLRILIITGRVGGSVPYSFSRLTSLELMSFKGFGVDSLPFFMLELPRLTGAKMV
eukprot:CAMPEP_0114629818 /NCGR_PEP_ID=MMETSP0168-20121206/13559_1 /TAXON_ID=95228 ORGANISM="Vannella sp., Strain DIVA3 517/6/12" /NCGR_SAMPLE_ID=MMETSP0168 /ASSEMBLY_ACC=CAM_ASM_000044 /LENGTH=195 /DNA_ID=CAMNT_0001841297 /DNA_START=262 /DNA_END=846 /DNA_ORIENTATION=-